jgi:hypothetical protein
MTHRIIGVYKFTPTVETIIRAAQYHGYHWLINERGEYVDSIRWSDFENLALIEVYTDGEFSTDDVSSISQDDQSPYLEFYLDAGGHRVLSEEEAIAATERRVCFFLHFVDTTKPLQVGGDQLELPPMARFPERLMPYAHYVPVD